MLKIPSAVRSEDQSRVKVALAEAALKYRIDNNITSYKDLCNLNITAWLYLDEQKVERIQINPNITIRQLQAQFGPADTRDAEVGIHSEGQAGQFFLTRQGLQVVQIFSERIPCAKMCAPMLDNYFKNIPVTYYYRRSSWPDKNAGEVLGGIYGIEDPIAEALDKLEDQYERLRNAKNTAKSEHASQLNLIRKSFNPMGRAVQAFNPVSTPELSIWNDVEASLSTVVDLIAAKNPKKAAAFLMAARLQYPLAVRRFAQWKDGFNAGANRTYAAIAVIAVVTILIAAGQVGSAEKVTEGAVEAAKAEQTLVRIQVLTEQAEAFIRVASAEEEPAQVIEEILRLARTMG
jgi:Xanthomonas XOO_2897-like deaminase